MPDSSDERWMLRALALAERGRGAVEPNPMVGAVVVAKGEVVGEGFHEKFGGPHAEVNALDRAGPAARGATLYVTLEPCCHHGKTPPCTDRIQSSGVSRVVAAMADPFPRVAGGGIAELARSQIPIEVGCQESLARRLNAAYLTRLQEGRPFVHAKWAMSLDGKIATRTGESRWISSEIARRHAHRFRGEMDGILVGMGTVLADDPMLTARPPGPRVATRVVLDSSGRLPIDCQLVRTAREVPVLVATTPAMPTERRTALEKLGCEILVLPADANGRVPVAPLLKELGTRQWTNLLVEGGSAVLGAFLAAGLVDAARVYLAGRLIGGTGAPGPVGGEGSASLANAPDLGPVVATPLGPDVFLFASRKLAAPGELDSGR